MSTLTTDKPVVCQNCSRRYRPPEPLKSLAPMAAPEAARAVGWTVWEGSTIGGRNEQRVFCPLCAGRVELTDAAKAKATTWDAKCNTCDSTATEEWREDLPLSEDDVEAWKSDHKCEPWVELIKPKLVETS